MDDLFRYFMFKVGIIEMGWLVIECNIGENIGKNFLLFIMVLVMVNIIMIGVIDSLCFILICYFMFRFLLKLIYYKVGKLN